LELCRDVLAEGLSHARDGAEWAKLVAPVERSARDLRLAFPQDSIRLALAQIATSSVFFPELAKLKLAMQALIDVLEKQAERAETIEQCCVRAIQLSQQLHGWHTGEAAKAKQADEVECVLWVEAYASALQLHRTPLSIAPIFNKQREGTPRTWIFTSATMAVKNDFSHYVAQMGLVDEFAKTWPSPFNYEQQGMLYVPDNMPQPNTREYSDAVLAAALPVIEAAGGKTFLLCTTIKAVKYSAEQLRQIFSDKRISFPLFVQGEAGRNELLDRFRAAGNGVLIGSQSFWEGVDVRGAALSLVIIDKLPFAPPDDPVLSARIAAMERQGLNGFMHHQLPEAIINLKQGAGRLIRDESDKGVLMICDPRLISKPYGKRIWQSLPAFARTRILGDVLQFFAKLEAERATEINIP
jgi:ATP-dependent DNA helicase DinG